jgi:replicative DNA helicase
MSNQPALPLAQPGQPPAPRAAPHNLEAEQALLGAILFDNETMNRITSLLKEQHFYDPVHGSLLRAGYDRCRQLADGVTLRERFSKMAALKIGALYHMKLLENAAPLSHAQSYAD